jgi:hypothetical protein
VQWDVSSCSGSCPIGGSAWAAVTPSQVVTKVTKTAGGAPTPNFACGSAQSWWYGGGIGTGGNAANPATPAHTDTIAITGSMFYDNGAQNISMGHSFLNDDIDWDTTVPQNISIADNEIMYGGQYDPGGIGSGVWIGNAHHVTFDHNTCHHLYGGCVENGDVLGQDQHGKSFTHHNWITNNNEYDLLLGVVDDGGANYGAANYSNNCPDRVAGAPPTLGAPPYTEASGNTYCNHTVGNIIHDVNRDTTTGDGFLGIGIYNDQGHASHDARSNIVFRVTDACAFNNLAERGNDIYDQFNLFQWNVFASCGSSLGSPHVPFERGGANPNSVTFKQNIVNWSNGANANQSPGNWGCFDNAGGVVACATRFNFIGNLYWRCNGTSCGTAAPQFATCKVFGSCTSNANMNALTFAQWQAAPTNEDAGGSITTNPMFRSPGTGDFTPTNPALPGLGFPLPDLSAAGRRIAVIATPTNVVDMFPTTILASSSYDSYATGAPAVSLSPTSLTFGSTTVFTTSAPQTITLTNTGSSQLNVSTVTVTGDYAADGSSCIPSVAAGLTCSIVVTFTPTVAGTRTGTITITDNASGSPQTVSLTGTGASGGSGTADNRYCTSGNAVQNLPADTWGTVTPAPLASCFYTAVATSPSQTNHVVTVTDNASMATAIAGLACGDIVKITKGTHLTPASGYVISLSCPSNNWWVIESSGVSDVSFPAEGTRLTPCWAGVASIANRPTYTCPSPQELTARITIPHNQLGAFKISGNHGRLIGLDITRDTTLGVVTDLIDFTSGTTPNHVILDRLWLHGFNPDAELPYSGSPCPNCKETTRAVGLGQSNNVALIDSYVSDIYCIGSIGQCVDSQAVGGGFGALTQSGWGTYKIVNNHLEAAAEGMILGGANGPALTPGGCTPLVNCNVDVPVDIEVRRNFFFKPHVWDGNTTVKVTTGYPNMKNGFEIKSGARWLIEGNVIQNVEPNSDQPGQAFLFSAKNPNNGAGVGSCPTCEISDLTVRYNYAYHAAGGIAILTAPADSCPACTTWGLFRGNVHDNLVEINIGTLTTSAAPGDGWQMSAIVGSPVNDIAAVHNTISKTYRSMAIWGTTSPTTSLMNNWYFDNNITPNGSFGLLRVGATNTSCDFPFAGGSNAKGLLDACVNPYEFLKNDILGASTLNWPTDGHGLNNFFHTTSTVLFTNYNAGDSGFNPGNYLLQMGSPGHLAGTDLKT